ncbi:uncharacterized protein ATC70_004552 [Mucor velutinosus]|uniref:Uncharacterized protein n=1 Tax=Mucor velutinosus TaxID=708070 RepID=A0AAN7DS64_9FUNG|nr:hypothetical protein ATC70_004552 [Mucor velutinosus]
MMRQKKNRGLVFQGLDYVNNQVQQLQHSIAEIEILKAGKFWREHGEKSAGDPTTDELCRDQYGIAAIATDFYSTLFTPDPTDSVTVSTLIRSIPGHLRIQGEQQESLILLIDIEDLLEDSKKTRRLSSPGPDGLPYEILERDYHVSPMQERRSGSDEKLLPSILSQF